jgi:molybdate transport system substrate-binding protein
LTPVRRVAACLSVVLAAGCAAAGCGGNDGPPPGLDVAAATSLRGALSAYADGFGQARVRLQFAGSDAIEEGIRAGEHPDVYAAAEAEAPDQLFSEGLVEQPVLFAANELVLAVPRRAGAITRISDLARPGVTLAVAGPRVSLGEYTDVVLDRLNAGTRDAIQAHVAERPPDAGAVVESVATGRVDAGFVYLSDVRAARGRLRAIRLPAKLQPSVLYKAAVVRGTKHEAQARAFVDGLRGRAGRSALEAAGFRVP